MLGFAWVYSYTSRHFETAQGTGAMVGHMKDRVLIGHLAKFDVFRVNGDQDNKLDLQLCISFVTIT